MRLDTPMSKQTYRPRCAIFKLNVEQYPESYHVYDSYGDALLESGDQALAIENYKKSLALNPANPIRIGRT